MINLILENIILEYLKEHKKNMDLFIKDKNTDISLSAELIVNAIKKKKKNINLRKWWFRF